MFLEATNVIFSTALVKKDMNDLLLQIYHCYLIKSTRQKQQDNTLYIDHGRTLVSAFTEVNHGL